MKAVKNRNNVKLGVILAVVASFSAACMNSFVKELGDSTSTSVIVLFRFTVSFLCILPWIIKDKKFTFKIDKPLHYFIRIAAALLALICMFTAVKSGSLTSVLLLSSTTPLFIPIFACVFYKVRTHASIYIVIAIGFVGVAIVLQPIDMLAADRSQLLALLAGAFAAVAILEVRVLSKTNSLLQILFYYYSVSMVVAGFVSIYFWKSPSTIYEWLILVLVGVFGTVYQISITYAVASAPSRIVTPLAFTSVIWGGLIEYFVWNKLPTLYAIVGFPIIIVSIVLVVYLGNKYIIPKAH